MNKFYKEASVGPAVSGGFVVLLDGRPVRTPQKQLMASPTSALAEAMAAEWAAQEGSVSPETMPLTQLLTTSIDRAEQRGEIAEAALKYLDSDLLCYRADEPEELVAEQNRLWSPWLSWFARDTGTALETTFALTRLDQSREAHAAARARVEAMDDHVFTAFHLCASVTGSIVLGLAMAAGKLQPEDAWRCALCEELFYERIHDLERHGLDPTEERRRANMRRDLDAAAAYITLSRT